MHLQNAIFSPEPIERLEIVPLDEQWIEPVREVLYRHHAMLVIQDDKTQVIFFPQGTTRTEIFPRLRKSRYRIALPDGFSLTAYPQINGDLYAIGIDPRELPARSQNITQAHETQYNQNSGKPTDHDQTNNL